jgi:hypothetical protein
MPLKGLQKSYEQYKEMGKRTREDVESLPGGRTLMGLMDEIAKVGEVPGVDMGMGGGMMTGMVKGEAGKKLIAPFL